MSTETVELTRDWLLKAFHERYGRTYDAARDVPRMVEIMRKRDYSASPGRCRCRLSDLYLRESTLTVRVLPEHCAVCCNKLQRRHCITCGTNYKVTNQFLDAKAMAILDAARDYLTYAINVLDPDDVRAVVGLIHSVTLPREGYKHLIPIIRHLTGCSATAATGWAKENGLLMQAYHLRPTKITRGDGERAYDMWFRCPCGHEFRIVEGSDTEECCVCDHAISLDMPETIELEDK